MTCVCVDTGALKHFSPSRLSAVVARRVHAHVATPTSPAAMQDLSYDAADTKVDRSLSLGKSAAVANLNVHSI